MNDTEIKHPCEICDFPMKNFEKVSTRGQRQKLGKSDQ